MLRNLGSGFFGSLGLFLPDAEQQVQQNTEDGRTCDAGDLKAEKRDVAAKRVIAADANDHDGGDDRDIFGGEHVHLFVDHNRNTLRRDRTEQIDFQPTDDRQRDAVDHLDERGKEADNHGDDGRHDQHRNGKHLGNGHGADVFAVVGAGRAADKAGDHIADTVADQVTVQHIDQAVFHFLALPAGDVINVYIQLVHMGGGFRDGGDGDGHDRGHRAPGLLWQGESRHGKNGAVAQAPDGSLQSGVRHGAEQIGPSGRIGDAGHRATGQHAEQQGKLAQEPFEIAGIEDGGNQCHKSDDRPHDTFTRNSCAACDVGNGVAQGVARQGKADDHGDRTGDGRGQDGFNRLFPEKAHQQTGRNGDQAGKNDAELGVLNRFGGQDAIHLFKAFGGAHAGDRSQIGKAGAVVQGDLPAGYQDKAKGGQAAGENGGGDLKPGDQSHRNGGGEHDNDLLDGVQ